MYWYIYIIIEVYLNGPICIHNNFTTFLIYILIMQVPLGVIMKCETMTNEMIDILTELQRYVPQRTTKKTCHHPLRQEPVEYNSDIFHQILFGGDQLTAERIRLAQRTRSNSNCEEDRLMGFIPVIEDWHAEVTLLSVYSV